MLDQTKTYSGTQAYHEMLIKAQALCPALTYALCSLLLKAKEKAHTEHLYQVFVDPDHRFYHYFGYNDQTNTFGRFIKIVFHNLTVNTDEDRSAYIVFAHKQFVEWLKTGVVVLDDKAMLATVTL